MPWRRWSVLQAFFRTTHSCTMRRGLCVQLLFEVQTRLLTRMLGGCGMSPVTSSPEPEGRPPCTTPHSIRVRPARMLSCFNRWRAPICEQSIPVDVIWAQACGWRTHATTMRIGSATYHNVLVLSFVLDRK